MKATNFLILFSTISSLSFLSAHDLISLVCLDPYHLAPNCNETLASLACTKACGANLTDTTETKKCVGHFVNMLAINATEAAWNVSISLTKAMKAPLPPAQLCMRQCKSAVSLLTDSERLWNMTTKFDMRTINIMGSAAQTNFDTCRDGYGNLGLPKVLETKLSPAWQLINIMLVISNMIY
ncbi:plant invertase/pectin methylesterase inhibitor [Striga asiatica]|uniref:Plant invertase/pectin methylesterase inhibitor n=1 Tax=Striga asiatica TaxID=4170 RepID=A0A5A7Q701_STRAF|nr:plant invertase/pectin methylesterase inhibitor [Striga asiatica]